MVITITFSTCGHERTNRDSMTLQTVDTGTTAVHFGSAFVNRNATKLITTIGQMIPFTNETFVIGFQSVKHLQFLFIASGITSVEIEWPWRRF